MGPLAPSSSATEALAAQAGDLSPEERAEARRYGQNELACTLADKAFDLAYLAIVAFGVARPLDQWLATWPLLERSWYLRAITLLAIVLAVHVVVSMPLAYYAGYVLEHRFGLSRLSRAGWLWRYAKRVALATVLSLGLLVGLGAVIRACGPVWWLVGAVAFFVVSVVLGLLIPVLILPMFYKVQPLDAPELRQRLERLLEGTGLKLSGVYRLGLSAETTKANAMLAGLGRTRRVLLGDTLLDRFTPEEIEVIFAHEVGHHQFGHLRKMLLLGLIYSLAGFWVCDWMLRAWAGVAHGAVDYAALPVHVLPLLMLVLAVLATLLEPLQNTVSRHFERQCDRYALKRTGLREAYISAFRKLARQNKNDPDPPWLEVVLFHSHPPIAQRVALAEQSG